MYSADKYYLYTELMMEKILLRITLEHNFEGGKGAEANRQST